MAIGQCVQALCSVNRSIHMSTYMLGSRESGGRRIDSYMILKYKIEDATEKEGCINGKNVGAKIHHCFHDIVRLYQIP